MTKFKKTVASVTSLAVAMTMSVSLGAPASAQTLTPENGVHYDGYCYVKKSDRAVEDALVGAAAGAAIGTVVSKKNKKVKGAVIGAAIGGAAGAAVGSNAAKKITCYQDKYFVYTRSFYEPSFRTKFKVVYFENRPENMNLYYKGAHGEEIPYRGN